MDRNIITEADTANPAPDGSPAEYTPRRAALVLTDALGHLNLIEPSAVREPVRQMLRAGIELCATTRSLAGKPVMHTLALAEALIEAGKDQAA